MRRKTWGSLALVGYISTIVAANWALKKWGIIELGPQGKPSILSLSIPAGAFFAGLAFTLRDLTQEGLGKGAAIAGIILGALVSLLISPAFAVASAVAFLISEAIDFGVYQPLRSKNWISAVVASNIAGLVFDSALFLYLAFGSFNFLAGQVLAKVATTVAAVALLAPLRRRIFKSMVWEAWQPSLS